MMHRCDSSPALAAVDALPPNPAARRAWRLLPLLVLALLAILAFMTTGTRGDWGFILAFRGIKLATMVLVACAIAISTVLFQTITHNRILTPALIGFDALYTLIQAAAAFSLGTELTSISQASGVQFLVQVAIMTGLACLLFRWLFTDTAQSLHRLILVGITFGLLFRSLANLLMRLIDPNEFVIVQDKLFASFNSVEPKLLGLSTVLLVAAALWALRLLPRYDVLALGRDIAINLGVPYQRTVMQTLVVIAVLVAVSTALVGPITFLGLLVSNLAYHVMDCDRHRLTLPAAILIGIILLVGGQTVLEHVLHLETAISVVIEFTGGLLFLLMVTRKAMK